MTAASSIPPVLATEHAAGYLEHLRRCRGSLLLQHWVRPPHVALAATTILPAIDRINREHIARWQEAETERGQV